MFSKETDQLQDVQHRVELARRLFVAQGEFIYSVIRYVSSNNEYIDDLFTDQLQDVQHRVELARRLFVAQGEFIYSVIRYVSSNNEYIDDLFHDVFLFFVAKPIPDDVLNIRGYLYKVVLDKVRDWQRSHIRYETKIRHYTEIKSKQLGTSNKEADSSENVQKIFSLIEKHLSKTEGRAISLRYKKQYAIEEVAKEMNIKPRSASRYISVGLKKIRSLLNMQERADHEEGK